MSAPQFRDLIHIRGELCRVRLSGQDRASKYLSALRSDIANEVGQGPTLTHEIVDQVVLFSRLDSAAEKCLMGEALKTVRTSVSDRVQLDDRSIDGQCQAPGEFRGQCGGNLVDAFDFEGVNGDEFGHLACQRTANDLGRIWIDQPPDQNLCGADVAALRRRISGVSFCS